MKAKEKKLNKKAKHLEERENKLRLVKKDVNKNVVVIDRETIDNFSISTQHPLKSDPDAFLTMASYKYMSYSTTFPSVVYRKYTHITDKKESK